MHSISVKFGILAALAMLWSSLPAAAEKVGVAAAVSPDAFSSVSGKPSKQLSIGKSIFYNERINTTASGLVQVLLVDGSAFTIGPNSELVIDKFIYDPQKKTGEIVATFSKGTMRFVGGKLSKNDGGVKVNTPAGALAVRGGIVQAAFGSGKGIISFIYGDYVQLTPRNGRGVLRVSDPGNTIDTSIGRIRPTTAQDIRFFAQAFAKGQVKQATINSNGSKKPSTFGTGAEAEIKNESEYARILGGLTPLTGPNRPNMPQNPVTTAGAPPGISNPPGGGGSTPPALGSGPCGGTNCGKFGNGTSPEGIGVGLGRGNR